MNGKTKNVIASLCAVAALAFAGIGGYMVGQSPAQPRDISASDRVEQQDMVVGTVGAISIPGFSRLSFKAGQTAQNVAFYNPEGNTCAFEISIILPSGKEIFHSGRLLPGEKLEQIEIDAALPAAIYEATTLALFLLQSRRSRAGAQWRRHVLYFGGIAMKKKGFSLMLCIALVFTMSASAFAADITEASTTVTKTVEAPPAPDVGSSAGPSNESSYEISIPASFSMDSAEFFEITASKMELEEKQELHVMVDYDRTFGPDGYFYLANVENLYLTIPCTISKGYSSGVYWETITGSDNSSVAVFNNIAGTTPDLFGAVKVSTVGAQTAAGTYTGKIYFNIQILNY